MPTRRPVAAVLASVPNVMTWDDHEIYDGYGSHDDDGEPSQQAFFLAAKGVWGVRLLARSVHPPLPVVRVDRGARFDSRYLNLP